MEKIGRILDHPIFYSLIGVYLFWVGVDTLQHLDVPQPEKTTQILKAITAFLWVLIYGLKIFEWYQRKLADRVDTETDSEPSGK